MTGQGVSSRSSHSAAAGQRRVLLKDEEDARYQWNPAPIDLS